jgi:phage terminase large subunit-like protein
VTSALTIAAKPRLEIAPPRDYSLGFAAVELMAAAGKQLDPWQVDACDLLMSVRGEKWACSEYCEWLARQNGKGVILEARALAGFLLFGESLIAWSAHEYRTAMEAFRRCKALIRALGLPDGNPNLIEVPLADDQIVRVKVNNTNGEESFERLDTGQRIKFIARSKSAGRGFTADVQIIDEAFAFTQEQQDALAPTQIAVDNPQTIYTSTPPLKGSEGAVMYMLRDRADKGGDDSLGYRDWGLGGWLEDLTDTQIESEDNWAATNPRVSLDAMRKLRRKLGKTGFARESLCVWPKKIASGNDVIDPQTWAARGDADSRPGEALVLAVDVSPGGRSAAIATSGRREDGRLHVKVVDYRSGVQWVIPRLLELVEKWSPKKLMLDPNGPAGALIADIVEAGIEIPHGRGDTVIAQRFGLELISGQEMSQACGALVNDLTEDRIRHADQGALNDAVSQASVRSSVDGTWKWDRRDAAGDICPLVAVTVAAHGFRLHGSNEEVRVLPMVSFR